MRSQFARWYPVVLAFLGAGISLGVYQRLPDPMAAHWDFQGNENGWMPRVVGAFLTPALILAMWGLFRALPKIDPRRENYQKFTGAYDVTIAAALLLLFGMHLIVLALALGYHVPVSRIVPVLVGVMFVVIGNVLPRARSNFMFGIRTPWTLSSDRVWQRTHRLGGYTMTIAGLVMIATGLLVTGEAGMLVVVAAVVGAVIAPVVYSYLTWKREMKQ